MKRKAYVIGNNTKKSLSPHIFNYWFKENNIDGTYLYKEINKRNFKTEIHKILNDESVCGFNITIPYKEAISEYINKRDEHAEKIGAINCVSKIKNEWIGKNTDWVGFSNSLDAFAPDLKKNNALVFGYGGAGKAIVYALQQDGFKNIYLHNRSQKRIFTNQNNQFLKILNLEESLLAVQKSDIIINSTPVDLLTNLISSETIKQYAFDVVYTPKETEFLSHFDQKKRIYGIAMLVHQAAPCFEEWFGIKPKITPAIYKHLERFIIS